MARPKKVGIEYFGLDVYMGIDDEVELLEAEYGLEGFAIFIKLLQAIYRNGYYINWTNKEQLLFSKRVNVTLTRVNDVITSCLEWGLFHKEIYKCHGVLTSRGIQQRFLLAVVRRTSVEIYRKYLLLSEIEVNATKNLVIVTETSKNDDNNPQSKVKESKVKESKVEVVGEEELPAARIQKEIENSFGKLASRYEVEVLESYLKDGMEIELVIKAIHESVESGAKTLKYTKKILNRCMEENILTLERYLIDQENFKSKESKDGEHRKGNHGDNGKIEYSQAELAAMQYAREQQGGSVEEEEDIPF